ncbi:MAG: SPFH domain-containing protein [Gammaproteobacteria bacterium]|nr:SPFH domain-containing protein [Gammaproteobacteria bacterium]MDH5803207.1 SPFH domain-containing protein [Gammaproteobacteria bacterium]
MGLFDKIMGEFIDVIEWTDDDSDETLVYRFPTYNKEIQMGSSLIVRESQAAVFVYKGKIADVYAPGHYKLTTESMPVMSTLQHWTHGFNTPFKSEVYFFNMRQFTDVKWGTPNPITLRDPEFGMLRIRAFGNYSMRVDDPVKLMKDVSGTDQEFKVSEIEDQLRAAIISGFTDFIAESKIPFLDYAANLNEFSTALKPAVQPVFKDFGLSLEKFFVINVSVPPEVEKVLDQRAGMVAVGNLDDYTKFQAANSISDFAKSGGDGGSLAGAGVGAGVGMAVGTAMAGALTGQQPQGGAQGTAQGAPQAPKIMIRCMECNHINEETSKFCSECGNKLAK